MESPPPGYPPDYPPPPPPPTPEAEAPGYFYAPPAPQRPARSSRRLATVIAAIAAVGLVLAIAGTYGVAGYYSASSRLSSANRALQSAVGHQGQFDNAPSIFEADASDAKTMQSDAATFTKKWQEQSATIESDDQALASAARSLGQQQWLTVIRRGNMDSAAVRITHARKALDAARTVAAARVKEGQFQQALADAVSDFDALGTDAQNSDFGGAVTAAMKMQTDAGRALTLTSDQQFPTELHDYIAAVQTLASDFVTYLSAVRQGDQTTAKSLIDKANSDLDALGNYDITAIGDKIDQYYQPMIDTYHAELAKAA